MQIIKVLWRNRGRSAGARGECNDKLLMRVGLTVKVVFEQRPEEKRESVMLTSGRTAGRECGWTGVSWRKEKGSDQRDKRFCRRLGGLRGLWRLVYGVFVFILRELRNH